MKKVSPAVITRALAFDKVMTEFDFERVCAMMHLNGWAWQEGYNPPTLNELKDKMMKLVHSVIYDGYGGNSVGSCKGINDTICTIGASKKGDVFKFYFYESKNIMDREKNYHILMEINSNPPVVKPKTINHLIQQLSSVSEDKRDLPLVIHCPNGLEVFPSIKMMFKEGTFMTEEAEVEKMVITWRD